MYPEDLKYTEEHEWIRDDGGAYTVGITSFAAEQMGDITFVELPEVGDEVTQGGEAGTIESVKAASDLYSPLAGKICAVNTELEDKPELVNEGPYDQGWIFKLAEADAAGLDVLMDAAAYEKFAEELDQ